MHNSKGFSLIELLIVIGLTAVLATSTISVFGNFQLSSQLNDSAGQMVQVMRQAKELSQNGFLNSRYGVYFEKNSGSKDRFVLYKGNSFATRDTDQDKEYFMESIIRFSTTTLAHELPDSFEVNFARATGIPSNYGDIILDNLQVSMERRIQINALGFIQQASE